MNYIKHLIRHRGARNLLSRAIMIYRRFGLTPQKSANALKQIVDITSRHGCIPSFFITADLLDSHGELIRNIAKNGVHVGLHGHHHIDHSQLSGAVQADEITRGLKKLEDHGIPVSGFRAPFLRFNEETARAVVDSGLFWSSHSVMLFQNNPCCQKINECSIAKNLLEGFYMREPYEKQPSLPMWKNEVLEIPVSLPDDELMVDRLGMRRPDKITRVWLDMLSESNEQGELFNLIFHPERFDCVAKPLDALLEKAVSLGNVWIASLDEIGRWWRDRAACSFEITPNGPHGYQVTSRGNAGASIALQRPDGSAELIEVESNSTFNLEGRLRPTVGVSSGFCDKGAPCLLNEGFVVETGRDHASCAVSLDGSCPNNRRRVLEILKTARSPLLRVARWPHGYRSALAITLDLDAIILWDFVRRAWYFHKTARCRVEGSRH